jgi:hypothetical protein
MWVYPAPDPDLAAFAGAPRTLRMWLHYPHAMQTISLGAHWQDLDTILTHEPSWRSKSALRPQNADWTYPFAADHGAHALSSTSTGQLLHSIDQIERPTVEAYVALRSGLSEVTLEQVSTRTDELLLNLARLRESCILAGTKGYGLLLALWEETAGRPLP